jgi:hypothetical protein
MSALPLRPGPEEPGLDAAPRQCILVRVFTPAPEKLPKYFVKDHKAGY